MPVHRFVSDSVTIQMPRNWVVVEDESTVGKLIILSDARLKDAHAPATGAMGIIKIYVMARTRSPVEILRGKLYAEGGPPDGAKIDPVIISGHPAAYMTGLDELFDQMYLWYAALIQFNAGVVAYASFTGLGDYKKNGVIDAVVKSIDVDSTAFKTTLKAGNRSLPITF